MSLSFHKSVVMLSIALSGSLIADATNLLVAPETTEESRGSGRLVIPGLTPSIEELEQQHKSTLAAQKQNEEAQKELADKEEQIAANKKRLEEEKARNRAELAQNTEKLKSAKSAEFATKLAALIKNTDLPEAEKKTIMSRVFYEHYPLSTVEKATTGVVTGFAVIGYVVTLMKIFERTTKK